MKHTNWLANIFDWLGDTFETFNPAAFRFLSAILPYTTPLPVAWITMKSAGEFLQFDGWISFVFVFGLEGMGLWFTTLFVDVFVEWVKSKNAKSFFVVLLFGLLVSVYVYILVSLNVTLENSMTTADPTLSRVVTLLCFLPLLTGVGNGYYKLKIEAKHEIREKTLTDAELKEKIRQERREDRMRRWEIKNGVRVYSSDVQLGQNVGQFPPVQASESAYVGNWKVDRKNMDSDDLLWISKASATEVMQKYPVGRSTAYNWINNATEELGE